MPKQPNIIVMLADDMGLQDPSCFGGTAVATPNIDRIAASGMQFNNAYAASAVCSPSRAAILTGRAPLRFDLRGHIDDDDKHLNAAAITLPSLLKQAGYATGHVGKWHLGGMRMTDIDHRASHGSPGPHQHGFDHYLGHNEERGSLRSRISSQRQLYRKGGTVLLRDDVPVGSEDPYFSMHLTDINGAESLRMIESFHSAGKPFYLNLWWVVPHTPLEPAPEPHWTNTAAEGISDNQHRFRSMVAHMDARIGLVLDKLDALGIHDNTIIIFTSDNGGAWEADIGPYKGGKTDLHEGGLRVPFLVSWPERIPHGTRTDLFCHGTDIMPTLLAAVGIPSPDAVDGVNLLPHLLDGVTEPLRGTTFWQMDLYHSLQRHYPKPKPYSKEIVRRGNWKLLCFDEEPRELFDLKADPLEKHNLLSENPEIVAELIEDLHHWMKEERLPKSK